MKTILSCLLLVLSIAPSVSAQPDVSTEGSSGFPLIENGVPTNIVVSPSAPAGLKTVSNWFAGDLELLSGTRPDVVTEQPSGLKRAIIVGTVEDTALLNLAESNNIDLSEVKDTLEASVTFVANDPPEGIDQALVVLGSDKRGAIFGLFDISRAAGVSPWYWWADVPVTKQSSLHVSAEPYVRTSPKVRYRGIFLNDEAPALSGWAQEKFGGVNSKFYAHVFELILRNRGNFLWPAMWGRSLFDDDAEAQRLADEVGVVLSTSHHEPLQRSHVEWERYGEGPWDYSKNAEKLREFWREGIRRMGNYESVITLAMRGDGDSAMSRDTNIELLETIVRDQRKIIEEELEGPVAERPQVWALYKEVQEYYDRGMRVPDDVTLLLCDDNWGNVRRLPQPGSETRPGGYGMYYHYDYVGGPRNYKWLNTNPLPRIWEQMNLTYQHGVDRIWVVNVGDLKPMEEPIDFFLTMAWDPDQFPAAEIGDRLAQWQQKWTTEQFGQQHASDIAQMVATYNKLSGRRKPELLDARTYRLEEFSEWEGVANEWKALAIQAEQIEGQLPDKVQSAYYQLVLHPILASANLNELYYTVAKNGAAARQGLAITNDLADLAEQLYARDSELTKRYHSLNDGKWNHMMAQTHIGYTYWQQPDEQAMPQVERIEVPTTAKLVINPAGNLANALPAFVQGSESASIVLSNQGSDTLSFEAESSEPWVTLSPANGDVGSQTQLAVKIDWEKLTGSNPSASITIKGSDGSEETVDVSTVTPTDGAAGFIEANGYVSIDATSFSNSVDGSDVSWTVIDDLGRTGSAVMASPTTAAVTELASTGPHLEYPIHLTSDGEVTISAYLSPTLDFLGPDAEGNNPGIRFGISIDDGEPVVVDMHGGRRSTPERNSRQWQRRVGSNIHVANSPAIETTAGNHTLKFWRIDAGAVLQKLVVKTGDQNDRSYLGPPESQQVSN